MKKVSVHFNSVHDTYLLADCIEKDIPWRLTSTFALNNAEITGACCPVTAACNAVFC